MKHSSIPSSILSVYLALTFLFTEVSTYNILDHISEYELEIQKCNYYNDEYRKFKIASNNNGDPVRDLSKAKNCLHFKPPKSNEFKHGIIFIGIIALISFILATRPHYQGQFDNFVKMMEFIQEDSSFKRQNKFTMILRILFSFKFISLLILSLIYVPVTGTYDAINYVSTKMFKREEYPSQENNDNNERIEYSAINDQNLNQKSINGSSSNEDQYSGESQGLLKGPTIKHDQITKITRSQIDNFTEDLSQNQYNSFMIPTDRLLPSNNQSIIYLTYKDHEGELDNDTDDEIEDQENCNICHDRYHDYDEIVKLPCNHIFHEGCLKNLQRNQCPKCGLDLGKFESYLKYKGLNPSNVEFHNEEYVNDVY
ncbi:putative ATP-dependent helicase [Wickerhamomyces ciferrii]|uniref:RING-type E3 ubiquitin transferase n=1 Tax=Wickerhamomyces ciferrii (strain ATCC 14091 / BCRC 22168 / CBS 111 / JCM 3599 / NBRC 0793 / NRRL Y-1031 F-60-10) TaxID=1206466 RepID=K0KVF5_WICCF|nr:putative ATP-dependent helicase [Wickerhamomyces ciferrii]CCH45897.1 putative ATP-dependent helicase [Wickerhamomyces ciferrii]